MAVYHFKILSLFCSCFSWDYSCSFGQKLLLNDYFWTERNNSTCVLSPPKRLLSPGRKAFYLSLLMKLLHFRTPYQHFTCSIVTKHSKNVTYLLIFSEKEFLNFSFLVITKEKNSKLLYFASIERTMICYYLEPNTEIHHFTELEEWITTRNGSRMTIVHTPFVNLFATSPDLGKNDHDSAKMKETRKTIEFFYFYGKGKWPRLILQAMRALSMVTLRVAKQRSLAFAFAQNTL